tara:strand:- start:428 stop:1222 length:795 start_codon:yes stop_codon:yes gene_type:complete
MFGKKDTPKSKATAAPTEGDQLGPYPADVDGNPTRQRVIERALRMTTIGLGVSAVSNVALVALIIGMMPLQQVYPYLVTFKDSDEQVVALEPISSGAPGIQYATEASVREYVKMRHTFAPINSRMDAQWGPDSKLAAMTAEDEYGQFDAAAKNERNQMMARGFNRQIEIESATMIRPDTWQVSFTTIDSLGGRGGTLTADPSTSIEAASGDTSLIQSDLTPPSATKRWLATMNIAYEPQRVSYDKRLLNPLGFTVTDYSVTQRN